MERKTFEALFEHSSLGIIISNEEGIILNSNPFAARIFGYELGELNGKVIEVLLPIPLRSHHVIYRQNYVKKPHPRAMGSSLNLEAVKKNGEHFPVEVSLTFFESAGQKHIVSFVNDISERKRAENDLLRLTQELETKVAERTKELSDALLELSHTNESIQLEMDQRKKAEAQIRSMWQKERELNELKTRFVSMASHEFRTPLGGILTSVNLLAKYVNPEDSQKREKHIQTIRKSVKNLTNILNDFLSLDKLDQGIVTATTSEFCLNELVEDIVSDFRDVSEKHEIVTTVAENKIVMYQERDFLRNVIINLLSNAVKYSPDNTVVTLRVGQEDDSVTIEIEDQGYGIPETDQKHLFERFFRAHNVLNLQGTGLGLNIVKRYLDLMGGKITFQSKENQGTTFYLKIPRERK